MTGLCLISRETGFYLVAGLKPGKGEPGGESFVVLPSVTIERFIIKLEIPLSALIFLCIYTYINTKEMW